ncbi:MAG: hypothetical protein JWN71_2825 [Xanthobacteraceae bacterium]|nr:hypothetical protein [Xanthobacteraceae bacterium]
MKAFIFVCSLLSAALFTQQASSRTWPDQFKTPGATNPKVTQANIKRTICKSGWTSTIRPKTSYTNALKKQQIAEYGYRNKKLGGYEEDHLISLQLGGDPRDPSNLWPQPYAGKCGARLKDVVETKLKRMVCAGQITLDKAQDMIASNWVGAYIAYVREIECPLP